MAREGLSEEGALRGVGNMLPHSLAVINVAIEREFEMVDCFTLRKTEVSFFS